MSRIDEIFSVNKLSKIWTQKDPASGLKPEEGLSEHPELKNVMNVLDRMEVIIRGRYSDKQMIPFDILLESLKEKYNTKFKGSEEHQNTSIEKDAIENEEGVSPVVLRNEIIELLNTIEDVAEGFDCSIKSGRKG